MSEDLRTGPAGQIQQEYHITLKPNENGMAITVNPKLSKFDVSDLMIQAAGMAVLDDYTLMAILLPQHPYLQTNMKVIGDQEIDPADIAKLLRVLADGIEAENTPPLS